MTPTSRSIQSLKDRGYLVGKVEKWIPQARRRVDLFGFADLIAVGDDHDVLVQVSTTSNQAARVKKIWKSEHALEWLIRNDRHRIWVHGWKLSTVGKLKRWKLTETGITADEMMEQVL